MQKFLNSSFLTVFLLSFFSTQEILSQNITSDFELILQQKQSTKKIELVRKPKSFFQKINPLAFLYNRSLGFYQKNISVQIAANCVFEKTCSHFSKDLTQEFGIIGGVVLSIDRLSRCNRISIHETSPLNINDKGKIKESIDDYRF